MGLAVLLLFVTRADAIICNPNLPNGCPDTTPRSSSSTSSSNSSSNFTETQANGLFWRLDASNDDSISSSWDMHNYGFFNLGNTTFKGNDYLFNYRGVTSFYWNNSDGEKDIYGYLDPDNNAIDFLLPIVLPATSSFVSGDVEYGSIQILKLGGDASNFDISNSDPTTGGVTIEGDMLDIDSNDGFVTVGGTALFRALNNASAKNIHAGNICYSNGINCTATGGNSSWNQSLADTLYAGIEWDYNQTTATYNLYNSIWSSTYNSTYEGTTSSVNANNSAWLSTYNETYNGLINNASYLSTYNVTYAQFVPQFQEVQTNINTTNNTIWTQIFYFTMTKNRNYTLQCEILQNAQAGTTGSQYALNFSKTPSMGYSGFSNVIAGTAVLQNGCQATAQCTSLGTGQITSSFGRTTIAGRYILDASSDVNLNITLRSEVSGSWVQVYPNSWCKLWQEF